MSCFFSRGNAVLVYIGLHLLDTNRKLFYSHSANPFPEDDLKDVEDEARNFAEDLGALLDEIDFDEMAEKEQQDWIENQSIFSSRKPPEPGPAEEPAQPEAAVTEPVQPPASVEMPAATAQPPEPVQVPEAPAPKKPMPEVEPPAEPEPAVVSLPPISRPFPEEEPELPSSPMNRSRSGKTDRRGPHRSMR